MNQNLSILSMLATTTGLTLALGCSSSSNSPSEDPVLTSLQSALAGQPDTVTQAAMATLVTTLNAEDWAYLSYAQWPDDDGSAALTDPTLQKAAIALALGAGATLTPKAFGTGQVIQFQSNGTVPPETIHLLSGGLSLAASVPQWLSAYPGAIRLMQNANGLDFAATAGAATAFAKVLAMAATANGSPLPEPTQPADGVLSGCGKSFYNGTSLGPRCSAINFCCQGEIDFPSGKTVCSDFTSCRGDTTPPMLSEADHGEASVGTGSGDASGGSTGDGTNPCFVGGGVTPAYNQACQALNVNDTQFYNCLDPSSAPGLGAPQLPDGSDPSAVCVAFTDSSGVGTPLGQVTECDPGDPGYVQCWCCPN